MAKSETKRLPDFHSLDELVTFFDDNDMGDYLAQMPEVDFDVNLKHETLLVTVDTELAHKLDEIARLRKTSAPALIQDWLREKVLEHA